MTPRRLSFEACEGRCLMAASPISVEAEDMQLVGFRPHERDGASGGEYVSVRTNNYGEAKHTFTIAEPGTYALLLTVKAPAGDKNALAFSIDGGPRQTWSFPTSNQYTTHTWPAPLTLSAGQHTIQVFGVDAGTQFDKFELKPLTTDPPTDPPVGPLDPAKAPGQNFDLSRFKLTLPVNSSGGLSGTSKEIGPQQLATYQSDWFKTSADGAMQFTTPVVGAKTSSNTSYTRTELRELNADGSLAKWTVAQGGKLAATVAVNQMPVADGGKLSRIVIGQIHGPDDELCRLYFDQAGKLYYGNDKSPSSEVFRDLKDAAGRVTSIPLGARFDYSIIVAGGRLVVSVTHNGTVYSASEAISSFWAGKGLYFKAGLYLGVGAPGSGAGTTGSGTGRVSFYSLRMTH